MLYGSIWVKYDIEVRHVKEIPKKVPSKKNCRKIFNLTKKIAIPFNKICFKKFQVT